MPADAPRLLGMIDDFEKAVLAKAYRPEDADVLLSTVCQAKGLEWPRVMARFYAAHTALP